MANITTIAKSLGVSPSTVSRALQKPQMVSAKTRHLVLHAAKEQGYLNKLAKDSYSLQTPSSLIGILVADLTNSFSNMIVKTVQDFAYSKNYSVVVGCTYEQNALETQLLKQWDCLNLKGIVVMPSQGFAVTYKSFDSGIPLVTVDRALADLSCDSVVVNNKGGMEQILDHLTALGHKKIVVLSGSRKVYTFSERADAAQNYSDDIEVIDINAVEFDELYMGAFEQTSILLMRHGGNRPTAIVGANNAITAGILYALNLKGIKVPDVISVVAYGDSKWGRFYPTPVTSLRQPVEEMGTIAARLLFERINGKTGDFEHICLEPMLLTRASTDEVMI